MNLKEFENHIYEVFGEGKLNLVKDKGEFGFTNIGEDNIIRLGICTNLTVETALQAVDKNIDLLLTHHDAWDFMQGIREECISILKGNNISHYYIHLPLDDAEFGNNVALLERLGFEVVDKFSKDEGLYCGRIGELKEPMEFEEFILKVEDLLEERVRSWKNNTGMVKRVGLVTGAGFSAVDIKEAWDLNCDTYITGEKILYTVQYAKFKGINLVVGSHTFTETFGVERLAGIIKERFPEIEVIKINEEHIE